MNLFDKIRAKRIYKNYISGKIQYNYIQDYNYCIDYMDINREITLDMKSGKRGVYKIVSCISFPDCGSKDIKMLFIRYEGEKKISDMDFEEFFNGGYWKLF